MAGFLTEPSAPGPHIGMKRPSPADSADPVNAKRQRVFRHALRHKQAYHVDPVLTPQDEVFFQSQLLRAISMSLSAVGFDGANPSALESFRAEVDEYILHFLSLVRTSMLACRRLQPTPQDFVLALAQQGFTPSSLLPHLQVPIPPSITQPPIPPPPSDEAPPPALEGLLGPDLAGSTEKARRSYIPSHFPDFPSRHTWQDTPIYTARETDPRKIRERAIEEGIMAEQALRKLMAANTSGGGRRGMVRQRRTEQQQRDAQVWEETLAAVMREDEAERRKAAEMDDDWGLDGAGGDGPPDQVAKTEPGMLVNYDRKYWRQGTQEAGLRAG